MGFWLELMEREDIITSNNHFDKVRYHSNLIFRVRFMPVAAAAGDGLNANRKY